MQNVLLLGNKWLAVIPHNMKDFRKVSLMVPSYFRQQEKLETIDRTIGTLVENMKILLTKLEQMENVKKLRQDGK